MPLLTRRDLGCHHGFTWLCLAALAGMAGWLAWLGQGGAALGTLAALAGCLGLILPPRERMEVLPRRLRALPRGLDATPVLATLLSTPGYGLGWFYQPGPYDEVVHLVNGVMAGLVFAAAMQLDGRSRSLGRMALIGAGFGLALATGWELFEAATGLIGDWTDTWTDVVLTTGGAVGGAALAGWRWPATDVVARAPR
ncbi:hypothetical protein [Teichococcus vastitatis]|jgi:hypothetical protein|uniref:VanZ like family protein n=1 Tax=Teichococcus vastitatis TaxID=2307076 RepID=A0ABS9WAW0_9PROT|nr:hypothetical protein [Pseudoroseomonas vastitatis]MCI0755895.1 hypothetical protein [Pseudoroseomonas vastitatis]